MNQTKLCAALVAAALATWAAPSALAACAAPNGATPFLAGPLNPVNGYAEYVTDSNGLSLQICTNADLCFFDPVITGNLLSSQTGTGTESFYWLSEAVIDQPGTGFGALVVMATEATYTTAEPVDGEQLSFTRFRIRLDVPQPGLYRVEHPYGVDEFEITAVEPGRDLSETFDLSFTPGQADAQGKVGPWLRWDPAVAPAPPTGYIGDGATPHRVVGSPCGTNFVRVTARTANGAPIQIADGGGNVVQTTDFVVQGQLYDGKVQTPLATERVSYSRTPGRVGQIDTFARSVAAASVSASDTSGTPAEAARLSTPVPLAGNADGAFFASTVLADAPNTTALPVAVDLRASVADQATDATRLVRALIDQVTITQADYDLSTRTLTVAAQSSDSRVPPTLTIQEYLSPVGQAITTDAPPSHITVMSSAGGWQRTPVRVVPELAPTAPTALNATVVSATQVDLAWTDNSLNESGFEVRRNGALIASLPANTTAFSDTAAPQGSTLTYTVSSVNSGGRADAASVTVTTPVVLAAPASLVANADATGVTLTWTDTNANEASTEVLRNGVVIATLAGSAATGPSSYRDTTVAPQTTYTYVVRATHATAAAASSNASTVTTPARILAPTNLAAVTSATNAARLNWTDASIGETAYRVQRATVTIAANGTATVGAFAVPTTPTGNLAANAATYTNTGLTANTVYAYEVNAVDGATQGAVSRVYFVNGGMPAVAGLRSNVSAGLLGLGATPAGQVPLSWTASTLAQVAGYEIQRCIGAATVCTATSTGWATVTTVNGRATASFTVTGVPSGQLNQFRIRSPRGATGGQTGAWSAAAAGTPR
jgi:hypothetical protein